MSVNYTCVRNGFNKIFVRQSDGQIFTVKQHQFKPKIYLRTNDPAQCSMHDIRGNMLAEQAGINGIDDAKAILDEKKDLTYIYAQPSLCYEYIREKYLMPGAKPLTKLDVYGLNWDIETGRDDKGYSSTDQARCPITAICVKDSRKDYFQAWSTKPISYERIGIIAKKLGIEFTPEMLIYNQCKDEKDLIFQFIKYWMNEYPDYITGWNCVPCTSKIFFHDHIDDIASVKTDQIVSDGDGGTTSIQAVFPTSKKHICSVKLATGHTIESSKEHIFPIRYGKIGRYTSLRHGNKSGDILFDADVAAVNIVKSGHAAFMKMVYHQNNNDDVAGISDDQLYLLGIIYTDGTLKDPSNIRQGFSISQSDLDFLHTFDDILTTKIVGPYTRNYRRGVKHSILNGCEDYIYADNKKKLNINKLSRLSYRQFMIFLSGFLDGDGWIHGPSIGFCDYNGCRDDLSLLCQWNGMFTTLQGGANLYFLNIKFNDLSLRKVSRWGTFRPHHLARGNSQLSENIKYQFVGNDLYVRIDDICQTDKEVDMIDISTDCQYFISQGVKSHNCTGYDIPYLINRTIKIFATEEDEMRGLRMAEKLSPFGKINLKEYTHSFNKKGTTYDIVGVNDLDYLTLYKKFTYGGHDSYKLDQIGKDELGQSKISYEEEGNLFDLYNNDFDKFILYNMTDVDIVENLDKKLNLINLVMSLAYMTGANWPDMVSPVKTWDVYIYNVLANANIMIPWRVVSPHREAYIGAFVKDPIPRMYKWVASFDLNSLYPHLQMGHNLSPDRLVPREEWPVEIQNYVAKTPSDTVERIKWMLSGEFDNTLFKKYNLAFTPNGQCWSRESDGFIPKILDKLYKERSSTKKLMLDKKQEVEELKKLLSDDV